MVNGGTGEIDIGGYEYGQEIGGPPRSLTHSFYRSLFHNSSYRPDDYRLLLWAGERLGCRVDHPLFLFRKRCA